MLIRFTSTYEISVDPDKKYIHPKQYKNTSTEYVSYPDTPYRFSVKMYAEEYLPDDAIFEEETDVSIDETSSMDTTDRDRRKRHELYKRSDPDYYSFKINRQNEDDEIIQYKVEVYSSPVHGFIRNASSGVRESYRVCSKYEDLFFRVKDVGDSTKTQNKEPRKLFYKNPEEFERHQFVTVPQDIKKAWNDRYIRIRSRLS